ncbi:MAG: type II secretion system protein GspI [Gammaproteobacteria bacterium]|nr:type II secretion system protein GspI [Gammaproteobacteria bacterium]
MIAPIGLTRLAGVRGFTLIEVLVSLVIVALGIAAVMSALLSSADGTDRLRERSLAEWVAANRILETRLAKDFPALGSSEGKATMGGRDFQWRQRIERTAIDGVIAIVVEVRAEGARDWLVTLRGGRSENLVVSGDADALWDTAVRTPP